LRSLEQLGSMWEVREVGTAVPAVIIITALLLDIRSLIYCPRFLKNVYHGVSRPFQNFMTLDDLLEPVGPTAKVSVSKVRILMALSILSSVGWLGCFAFGFYTSDTSFTMRSFVFSICWVSNVILASMTLTYCCSTSLILH
jgi:hypothetical protein